MFECLRRRHRLLPTWVLGLFAALWLVALFSGSPHPHGLLPTAGRGRASSAWPRWGFAACPRRPTNWAAWLGEEPRCRPDRPPQRPLPGLFAVHCHGGPRAVRPAPVPPAAARGAAPAGQPRCPAARLAGPGPSARTRAPSPARLKRGALTRSGRRQILQVGTADCLAAPLHPHCQRPFLFNTQRSPQCPYSAAGWSVERLGHAKELRHTQPFSFPAARAVRPLLASPLALACAALFVPAGPSPRQCPHPYAG